MRRRVRSGWLVLALVVCASGLHGQVPEFVGAAERGIDVAGAVGGSQPRR